MLSKADQRTLAAIERQLLIDDPRLVRRLAGHPAASSSVSCRSAVLVLGILCTFAVVASLVPTAVLLGVLLPVGMIVSPWMVVGRGGTGRQYVRRSRIPNDRPSGSRNVR